ncbi:uncharacterized protein LOC111024669 isoform X2 [Momordica charantia]|nr:uncharacterized protein LOC111024669 isoform X2 [Momordica charantia]
MENDGGVDWNMEEEQSSGYGESGENIRPTMQKGYCTNVGKKLLITSLAISSAPLVLPPLAIISSFGFAASITYGVFLASYVCTEKIMSVWLPIPQPPIEEIVEDNGYQEDQGEDGENEMEITIKRDEVISDDLEINVVVVREDEPDTGGGEAATIEVTSVELGGNGEGDIGDHEEEELKETRGLLERMRDEGRRGDDNVGDQMEMSEANKVALHPHDVEYETSKASSKPAKSEEAEPISLVTIIDVVESGEDLAVSAVTVESKLLEPNVPHNKDYKLSSNEEISSELKIREKIDSMKKIVGYKATPLGTYIDEVNALYTFVGVEPPSPMKDSNDDDLNQLNQKLQFLMAIVGVK